MLIDTNHSSKAQDSMNVDLLLRIKTQILAEPELFDMTDWFHETSCGTACCIAGWGLTFANENARSRIDISESMESLYGLFGLSPENADRLFFVGYWPEELCKRYRTARAENDWQLASEIGAASIDHFIAMGE